MGSPTVEELADRWKRDKQDYVRLSTYSTYVTLLERHILPAFGSRHEIEEQDVQAFVLRKLRDGLSRATVQETVLVLKMILRHGAALGLCRRPDWVLHYPGTQAPAKPKLMQTEDVFWILQIIHDHPNCKNIGIAICLYTGLRIGEICALRWGDLDTGAEILHVRKTLARVYLSDAQPPRGQLILGPPKTGSSMRDVPLAKDLLALLKRLDADRRDPGAFVLSDGPEPLEPRAYRRYFAQFLNALGIPRINFHALRHTFASRCIEMGSDYKTVSDLLGHADIKTTLNLYVHPGMAQKKACVNALVGVGL